MKLNLDELLTGLDGYAPRVTERPDGSVVLMVAHSGKKLRRVVDDSYTSDEMIRLIKFDLLSESGHVPAAEVAKLSISTDLPTYTHAPICRTKSATLWESRKIKNL